MYEIMIVCIVIPTLVKVLVHITWTVSYNVGDWGLRIVHYEKKSL